MHHSCKTAGIEGNCVVHVGNLDWHVPIEDVRQSLMSFLAQLLLSEAIRDIEVAEFPLKGIRKKRDQGKIHQGHAFLRCFTESGAAKVCGIVDKSNFVGPGAPAKGALKASLSRVRCELGEEAARRRKEAVEQRDVSRLLRRAHNVRQKLGQKHRFAERLEGVLYSVASPGGVDALASWRAMQEGTELDWHAMPAECNPSEAKGGGLHEGNRDNTRKGARHIGAEDWDARSERKRWQVESFLLVLRSLFPRGGEVDKRPMIVDFGCGTGNLTLPLAWLMPHCDFVGLDMKQRSIELFSRRVQSAGLTNVRGVADLIEGFTENFDAGLALHACGNATDYAMEAALSRGAVFVVSPCCIGKLKFSMSGPLQDGLCHPRSMWLTSCLKNPQEDFAILARAADIAHAEGNQQKWNANWDEGDIEVRKGREALARLSKLHVELDRSECARERGYRTLLLKILHSEVSSKNDIIVGVPSEVASLCAALAQIEAQHGPVLKQL